MELGGHPISHIPQPGWISEVKSARCIINVAGPYMLTQGELMTLGHGQTGGGLLKQNPFKIMEKGKKFR